MMTRTLLIEAAALVAMAGALSFIQTVGCQLFFVLKVVGVVLTAVLNEQLCPFDDQMF